jgi:hypothetical protein
VFASRAPDIDDRDGSCPITDHLAFAPRTVTFGVGSSGFPEHVDDRLPVRGG